MKKNNKIKTIVIVLSIFTLVFIGLLLSKKEETNILEGKEEQIVIDYIVEIRGEINKPGLYYVSSNSRVNDIVILASGFTNNANTESINLTEKVYDGMIINITSKDENSKNKQEVIDISNGIVVKIEGEVKNPGYYTLNENSRVLDAVIKAGGLLSNADATRINLAKIVVDGEIIKIYNLNEEEKNDSNSKISINSATKEQLMTLPGIKDAKANNIINYRKTNGNFKSIEEIKNVSGISDAVFEQIKDLIIL